MTWVLHASDPHLGDVGAVSLDDAKEKFDGDEDIRTTQTVFRDTLATLVRYAEEHGPPAVAVISGDLTYAAHESGFSAFRDLLDEYPDLFPDRSKVVVVPGNHDVEWDEKPGTVARYAGFIRATRDAGCTTPLLDGIDFRASGQLKSEANRYPHVAETAEVLVIPINTSNYCGVTTTPRRGWTVEEWHEELAAAGADTPEILGQLKKLYQHDIARVSQPQFAALTKHLDDLGLSEPRRGQVRVAVLHHHLLPVSEREERKTFESLLNLEAVRSALRAYGIDVVLHGHKHEGALYWDTAGSATNLDGPETRRLVISSPGHFDTKQPTMRALVLEGPDMARNLRVVTFAGATPTRKTPDICDEQRVALWAGTMDAEARGRTVIAGETSDVVYSRLRGLFMRYDGAPRHNLVCEIADPTGADKIPADYPDVDSADRDRWFAGLVDWWQRSDSELVRRDIVPFNHGHRVYRRWGNQLDRAVRMLDARSESSRALIQLISPRETGRYSDDERPLEDGTYPAFVLAEFSIRNDRLECFAYFRKQEMQFWWPVNIAELARLQAEVASRLATPLQPGQIVTFSAVALWKNRLPAVAVPAVDLLVEEPGRLWDMALAIAKPAAATPTARDDWSQVLADLGDTKRRSRLGAELLADHVRQLTVLSASKRLAVVSAALEAVVGELRKFEADNEVNTYAADAIEQRVAALGDAVRAVLR